MKKTFNLCVSIVVLFSLVIFTKCSDDDSGDKVVVDVVELKVDRSKVSLPSDGTIKIAIESGNGEYKATSSNDGVAKASISGDEITITATSKEDKANAVIVITDKYFKRIAIDVEISKELDLAIDKDKASLELGVEGLDESVFVIEKGNSSYSLQLLDNSAEIIDIDDTKLESYGRFTVKAKAVGVAKIKLTDALKKEQTITITINNPVSVTLEKNVVNFSKLQEKMKINITSGNGKYSITESNSTVAKAKIRDDRYIELESMSNGTVTFTIQDSKKQKTTLSITVDAPQYAMQLGSQYFAVANFRDIAIVNPEATKSKQATFEMMCKMDGYRGLQTFMGLEGKLILRGLNDDYKATHPIAIVGLGDKIVLESSSNFNLNEWMHIALVVDCNASSTLDKYKLYINGIKDNLVVKKEEQTHTEIDLAVSNDNNRFSIGQATDQDWRAIRGSVSEVRIWQVARTEKQIKDNMCTLTEENPSKLFARWDFGAGVETDYIQDISGGKYSTDLVLTSLSNRFKPVKIPTSKYINKGCPQ